MIRQLYFSTETANCKGLDYIGFFYDASCTVPVSNQAVVCAALRFSVCDRIRPAGEEGPVSFSALRSYRQVPDCVRIAAFFKLYQDYRLCGL